jgi:phosphate transport system substrate-binding protein
MTIRTKLSGRILPLAFVAALAAFISGCGSPQPVGKGDESGTTGSAVRLQGAGATFPAPLYAKWVSEYGKVNPNAKIDYQSIGSGGGIQQITARTVDFGASDAPMSNDELKAAQGELLHIPTVLGAVVITYNLPGNPELKFSPATIADIFLGKITKWDDKAIKDDNPGLQLPSADISVVHRSDSSGTTAIFTEYLSKVSPEWKEKVGAGKQPNWPAGQGGKGNEGVMGAVKNQPNSIGYVELVYAEQTKLPVVQVKNASGNFVKPTLDSVIAAATETLSSTPEDLRVSITNAGGASVYPISSYTYVLIYKDQKDAVKGEALVDFLWWAIHDGEQYATPLSYAPLPKELVSRVEAKLNSITSGGQTLRK